MAMKQLYSQKQIKLSQPWIVDQKCDTQSNWREMRYTTNRAGPIRRFEAAQSMTNGAPIILMGNISIGESVYLDKPTIDSRFAWYGI